MRTFPEGFTWGCSTSSYQTEGSTRVGGRGDSIWDSFCRLPGRISDGSSGDLACDSWRRWKEDVGLARRLGVGAYRFSLSWPRIQAEGSGLALDEGLDRYRSIAEALLEAGIEPWVTLYHWDLPQALEDRGGWASRDTARRFADYAEIAYRALGDIVGHWVTFNEPWCSAFLGYGTGEHAPGRRDATAAHAAVHHHLLAHGLAVTAFRGLVPSGQIGIVLNPSTPRPATRRLEDAEAALRASVERSGLWLDPIHGRGYPADYLRAHGIQMPVADGDLGIIASPVDFVGVNYYSEDVVSAAPATSSRPEAFALEASWQEMTEMGWPIVPEGLVRCLRFINDTWSPKALYVTENGGAFPDSILDPVDGHVKDHDRIAYLRSHITACLDAVEEGIPLKGYFAWTLLDNFEWSFGYTRRFGLASVEKGSLERRPKDSFFYYRDVAAGNCV